MSESAYPDALPAHSRLHWYVIERVLGQGGFGITYLARDTNLDQAVAIKEYLPVEVATRMPDATIRARTEQLRERYRWGLERFIQEARTLARFDHRNIVRVHSVFEINGTAYMVMRFESGITLAALLDRRETLPEDELLRIVLPVLDGLALVHGAGFIHRDIKPDNIHLGTDGTPVLLDFGSARQSVGNSNTLTILVAPGYAPFEQYYRDSASQGPWTDIYGLGATCYRSIAGRPPLDAVSRSKGILGSAQEVMVSASIIGAGRYSGRVLAAIDHALAFSEKDRPQSVGEWRRELLGEAAASITPFVPTAASPPQTATPAAASPTPTIASPSPVPLLSQHESAPPARSVAAWVVAGVLLAAIGVGGYVIAQWNAETRTKVGDLEAQIQQKERAAQQAETRRGEAELAAKKKSDEDARERQAREQEARLEQERSQAEARTRDARLRAQQEATKRRESTVGARSPATRTPPPSTPASVAQPKVEPAPMPAAAAPEQAAPTAEVKAAPIPAVAVADAARSAAPVPAVADAQQRVPPALPAAKRVASAERASLPASDFDSIGALKSAADAGDRQAQARLGDLYGEGKGVPRDLPAAERWYEKAALQGDVGAQLKLGAMYANAGGAPRNNNLAYVWYGTALRMGSSAAKAERDRIGALLQPAEREQADRLIASKVARMPKAP